MPILVVDDEPIFRSAVTVILRKAGFQTIEARDGLEAYEIVLTVGAGIELLLTDLQMPRMDGLQLIESVRTLHPNMPVLLTTAALIENRPGSYAVLIKPFGRELLLQAVWAAIGATATEAPRRKVEIFSSANCGCGTLITAIRAAACPSCDIRVVDVTADDGAERAVQLGVHVVPTVAINDELVCCPCECGPDLSKLRVAGLGVPLS